MDVVKGHTNGNIPGCQKTWEAMDIKKGMEFLRARLGRLLTLKYLERACMLGMCFVNTIMATTMAGINSGGRK